MRSVSCLWIRQRHKATYNRFAARPELVILADWKARHVVEPCNEMQAADASAGVVDSRARSIVFALGCLSLLVRVDCGSRSLLADEGNHVGSAFGDLIVPALSSSAFLLRLAVWYCVRDSSRSSCSKPVLMADSPSTQGQDNGATRAAGAAAAAAQSSSGARWQAATSLICW